MNSIQVVIKSAGKNNIDPISLNKETQITAQSGNHYSIEYNDIPGSYAQNVIAYRSGNDLVLTYSTGEVLTISQFFIVCVDNSCSVLLASENGEGHKISGDFSSLKIQQDLELIYAQGDSDILLSMTDNPTVIDAFSSTFSSNSGTVEWLPSGSTSLTSSPTDFTAAFALTALGSALLYFSQDSSSSERDTTSPDNPTGFFSGGKITGEGEAGSMINVVTPDGNTLTTTVDDNGDYSINVPSSPNGSDGEYIITSTDSAGNISGEINLTVNVEQAEIEAILTEILEDSASVGGANNGNGTSVTVDQLDKVVDNVDAGLEGEYQEAIEGATDLSNPPTVTEVQAVIDQVNVEEAEIEAILTEILEDSASVGGGDNSNGISVTVDQLDKVVENVNAGLEDEYQAAIEAETGLSNPPTIEEVQAIIDSVNTEQAEINAIFEEILEDSASVGGANNGNGSSVTVDQLDKVVDNVDAGYETEYQEAIEGATDLSNPPTVTEVQAIIDQVNVEQAEIEAILTEVLEDSASVGGANNGNGTSVTVDQLDKVVDNVDAGYETEYQEAIEGATDLSNPPTTEEVQAIIDQVNTDQAEKDAIFEEILEDSASVGGGDNSNGISVTVDQLDKVVENVDAGLEGEYQAAIEAETGLSNPPTTEEVQAIIDAVNVEQGLLAGIFAEVFEDSTGNVNNDLVTASELEQVVDNVDLTLETHYQEAIAVATVSNPATAAEVQAIVDAVNAEQAEINAIFEEILEDSASVGGGDNSNGISVTVEQLAIVAENVDAALESEYQSVIEAESSFSNPPTIEEVQAIIDAVNLAPAIEIASDTGTSDTDRITSDATINVTGLAVGTTWEYSVDNGATWNVGSGTHFTLVDGDYALGDVQVKQTAGGITSIVANLASSVIDTTAGEVTSITISENNVVNDEAELSSVAFSGTVEGVEDGGTVNVVSGGTTVSVTVFGGQFSGVIDLSSLAGAGYLDPIVITNVTDIAGNTSVDSVSIFNLRTEEPSTTVTAVGSLLLSDTTPVITGELSNEVSEEEYVSITLTWTEYLPDGLGNTIETSRSETFTSETGDVVITGTSWTIDYAATGVQAINQNSAGSVTIDIDGKVVNQLSDLASSQVFDNVITIFQELSIIDSIDYDATTDITPLIVGVGGPGEGETLIVTVKDSNGNIIETFDSSLGALAGGIDIDTSNGRWSISDTQWDSTTLGDAGIYTIDAELTFAGSGGQVSPSIDFNYVDPQPIQTIANEYDDTMSKIYAQDDGSYWIFWGNSSTGNNTYTLVAEKFNSDGSSAIEQKNIGDLDSGHALSNNQGNTQIFDVAFKDNGDFVVFYTDSNNTRPYLQAFTADGVPDGDRVDVPQVGTFEQKVTFVKTDDGFVALYSTGTVSNYDVVQIRFDDELNIVSLDQNGNPTFEYVADGSNDGYGYLYNANGAAGSTAGSSSTGSTRNTDGLSGANLRSIDNNDYYLAAYQTIKDKNDNADLDGDGITVNDDPNRGLDVYVQVISQQTGEAVTSAVQVAENFGYHQAGIEARQLTDGSVVLTWTSNHTSDPDGPIGATWGQQSEWNVYMRRYDIESDGIGGVVLVPLDDEEIRVNTSTDGENGVLFQSYNQQHSVTALATGGFVVVWVKSIDSDNIDVYSQTYDISGNRVGGEVLISEGLTSASINPYVTGLSDGGYIVSWTQDTRDNESIDYDRNDFNDIYTTIVNSDGSIRLPGESAVSGTGSFIASSNDQVLVADVQDATNTYMTDDFTGVDITGGESADFIFIDNAFFGDIDGGNGIDTLSLNGEFDLDLSNLIGSLSNIESIQLGQANDNTLSLSLEDIIGLNGDAILTVEGGVGDVLDIDLTANTGWRFIDTQFVQGVEYSIYDHNQHDEALIWVDSSVTVI